MPTREEMLLEAEQRGMLPPEKQQLLEEARSRGLMMSKQEYEVRSGKNRPDWRGSGFLPEGFTRFTDRAMDPFGVMDEVWGGTQFVRKFVSSGGSVDEASKAYSEARDRVRAEQDVAKKDYGILPDIVGGVGAAGLVRGAVRAGAPLATQLRRSAGAGAAFGGVAGFGHSEGGFGERVIGAGEGTAIGAVAGPLVSHVLLPAAARTGAAVAAGVRYGNRAVRSARNPAQAGVDNVAERLVASGVDPAVVRARISPPPSNALVRRGLNDENMADIVSRSLRGEADAAIGQQYGIAPRTVRAYVQRYQENNPTPMNIIDVAKEVAGDGGAAPVTRLGRAAYSLAGDESGEAAQRLVGRQETQPGRVSNIVQRSVAGGDFEATRAAGLQNLQDEARTAYRQFYDEPDLGIDQLGDLMGDPLFRRASIQAQRQARVEVIRQNQQASRTGGRQEPVPDVDPNNQVFSPQMLDNIQRQLRIASEGAVSNPNNARHARSLREVFLDRIEDHYPTFRGIRRNYATAMGEFGEDGALEAGAALTTKLGAPSREALRGFDDMTAAQQGLFRLGFARRLMDMAANPRDGAGVANQFNSPAVREIVERLYPANDRLLHQQGQRLIRDLRREATTTRTRNDVMSGARTAELGSDMGRMMEGAQAAADVATGRWGKLLENLSTRLSTQLGRRGAREVIDLLTQTDPADLLQTLNRLARSAATAQQRQAYVMAIRQARSQGFERLNAPTALLSGQAGAISEPGRNP